MNDSYVHFSNKNGNKSSGGVRHLRRKYAKTAAKVAFIELKSVDLPLISTATCLPLGSLLLEADRTYTLGRARRSCDFVFDSQLVSKQHCQILFDSIGCKILIIDGTVLLDDCSKVVDEFRKRLLFNNELEEKEKDVVGGPRVAASLNGVYVNGTKLKKGMVRELFTGDEVLLACGGETLCNSMVQAGFAIHSVLFKEEVVSTSTDVEMERPQLIGTATSSGHSQGTASSGKRGKRVFALPANDINPGCDFSSLKHGDAIGRAKLLLSQCSYILGSGDPITCIRQCNILDSRMKCIYACRTRLPGLALSNKVKFPMGHEEEVSSVFLVTSPCKKSDCMLQSSSVVLRHRERASLDTNHELAVDSVPSPSNHAHERGKVGVICGNAVTSDKPGISSMDSFSQENVGNVDGESKNKSWTNFCSASGRKFYLNRLKFMDCDSLNHSNVVSLPELLYPVENISRIFIATFTSDILWFLSYCGIPCHLPVTVACHNVDRCWSLSPDARSSMPFPNFPNLVIVYPPFPEAIAFGNDCKKQGIACHHPKLLVLQREDSIRVVISSANLVAKQWDSVTNTVWWQDFPRRGEPEYLSLFSPPDEEISEDFKSDFAAQLAGFMASLIVDVPSQAHWIVELTKYDFRGATGQLVASVPGIYSYRTSNASQSIQLVHVNHPTPSSSRMKLLGLVETSVVGLSHLFHAAADTNGARLKKLALFLQNLQENSTGMLEVVLRRNKNIPADENAVSVLIPDPDKVSSGDWVQLGFLPRNVAKWVSPLWDMGFFVFFGYVYREEALASAFGGNNKRVQMMLHVLQGPCFSDISKMMRPEHIVALSYLIASVQRCVGLCRLQEVLCHYKWPESQESDFSYGASSIGSSVDAQFLAAFAAATGKRSLQFYDSEESDPEWGCWTASQELRNPSIRIIYPTINRVKNACNGIYPSRQILCFSEKTWQRLRTVNLLRDAIPHPHDRVGHPMHVKVARRRFWSKTDSSSFGWVYCGSHNFSAAAWGRPVYSSASSKASQPEKINSSLSSRLHVSNYELGIVFVFPPTETKCLTNDNISTLDDIVLPFVVPAPKYGPRDRPATAQAMREVLAELSEQERKSLVEEETTEAMQQIPYDEEEVGEANSYVTLEKEEDKNYAEILWNQVDSSQSC